MSDKLDANVNDIDTNGFVSKTKYDTYKADLEKKITNISEFAKEKQITTSALTAYENKIPDVSTLVKKKQKITMKKYQTSKRKLLIILMINMLLVQNLISLQQKGLLQP